MMEVRQFKIKNLRTRSAGANKIISGYFAVFNSKYQVWQGATESIAPGAFKGALTGDIRALFNHNTDIILGRTSAGTLTLKEDQKGLYGEITINEKDSEAMNVYTRVQRGDITGASINFGIEAEEETITAEGAVHWTITKIYPLIEVSVCTFPAYEETKIEARGKQYNAIMQRSKTLPADQLQKRRRELHKKLKGL